MTRRPKPAASDPRPPAELQPSAAEVAARARGFKGNPELAERFGIDDSFVRETVRVAVLPDPPLAPNIPSVQFGRDTVTPTLNLDDAVTNIVREEADELGMRLSNFGLDLTLAMRQDLVDHVLALLALSQQGFLAGGGTLARR